MKTRFLLLLCQAVTVILCLAIVGPGVAGRESVNLVVFLYALIPLLPGSFLLNYLLTRLYIKPARQLEKNIREYKPGNRPKFPDSAAEIYTHLNSALENRFSTFDTTLATLNTQLHKFGETNSALSGNVENILNELFEGDTLNSIIIGKMAFQNKSIEATAGDSQSVSVLWNHLQELIETQAEIVTSSSNAVQTMIQAISVITETTTKVSNQADELIQISGTGKELIEQSVEGIQAIARTSGELDEIVRLISEIASQTDILAINAAIEAAQAGDYGKGFSVVADEIKNLAEETGDNLKEIALKLESNTGAIKDTVAISQNAGQQFHDIYEKVSLIVPMIKEISRKTGDQSREGSGLLKALSSLEMQTEKIKESSAEMQHKVENFIHKIADMKGIARETGDTSQLMDKSLNLLRKKLEEIELVLETNEKEVLHEGA